MCDDQGRPVRLHLTAGQVSDFKGADVLLADLSDETEEVIGDRGYDRGTHTFMSAIHIAANFIFYLKE
ncbi:hypothetical protein GCM10022398_05170 [Acetobacter lovaniensis]|jgi:transposase|nr:transposase [Acetobacter lovaniensis NRIC 0474]